MSKTQILIVEDEGLVAKDLQAMLRRLGYHVPATVGTGELAIQTALANQPDLILMDIQLRGSIDGIQAASAINSEMDVPIVYLTANSDEATLERAKATGPFGFLVKPFEERAIQAGLEMALYKHKSEKQTREREQWLSTTLRSIADGVITTDSGGRMTYINSAAESLLGWTQSESVGRHYTEIFSLSEEDTRPTPAGAVTQYSQADEHSPKTYSSVLKSKGGQEIHIEYSMAPIRCEQGPVLGHVVVFSDISERTKLEAELRQAQKLDAIGKLAGGIAHDFNNALTAIIGYAELILSSTASDSPLHGDAQQIVRAADHSSRLTHQLLAFSRKQVLQPKCLDLSHELAGVEGLVRKLIGVDITLTTRVSPDLWSVMADAGQIQQVILNMAINARDAMPKGGELTIDLCNATLSESDAQTITDGRAGEFVVLRIRDTGCGMSPEIMRRIFEPFFTTKGPGKGTGLGLATCFGIVKQTAGMIDVSSELGIGTTFAIYLPRSAASAEDHETVEGSDESKRGEETVLVVEDEAILRELAVQVLESFGYRVIAAEDGVEATKLLQTEEARQVDIVVTDLVMPRMGGRELVEWIVKNLGEMRVIFTSGYTDDEIIRNAIGGAEVDYLQKPFTPKALTRKIREVLDRAAGARRAAA